MTVDDESSIYVGGIPYSATEESIRRVFSLYGAIIAVKIVCENGARGKCYGFVTFRNPRSVADAINDMDGKSIDGRVVRVNAATTRPGARSSFGRDHFRRNDAGWDRGRERQGDRYRERYIDRSRERDRSWDPDVGKERGYDQARDHDRPRDGFVNQEKGRYSDRSVRENEQGRCGENDLLEEGRNGDCERGRDLAWDRDREPEGTVVDQKIADKDTDRHARKQNGAMHNDRHGKEFSSELSDGYNDDEVKDELERSVRRLAECRKEVSQLEEELQDKKQFILDQQKKNEKLEDALINERKLLSQRRMQLTMLQKYFLQVKEYQNQLKRSEQEFESLLDSPMLGSDMGGDVA